jgi:O-antigen/teichoic acid export membrane protein
MAGAHARRSGHQIRSNPVDSESSPVREDSTQQPPRSGGKSRGRGSLGNLAAKALGWSFLSTFLSKFGLMGFGVFLARLLGPHQYGTAAVAMVALLAVLSINELGVSLAIVRWPGDPAEIVPTVTTISVGASCLFYIGAFLAAPSFAAAMGSPASTPIIRVITLIIIANGWASVPAAILQRHFRQDRQLIVDQVHGWLGAIVSVVMAIRGFGPMSLAIGQVSGATAGAILLTVFSPVPFRFGFNSSQARKLMHFGLPLAGSSLVVFLVLNADNFIAGHVLGATALGFYVLAWNLASLPVNMFSQPVRNVAPALFARLQGNPVAMRTGFASIVGLLGAIVLPICLVMSGCAVPLVRFIYGDRWSPAAQALLWLSLLASLRILFELAYDYFVVLSKSRVVLTVQLVWLSALIPALIAGAHFLGIRGVAIAGFAVAFAVILPWYLYELGIVGIRIRTLAARLWLPLVSAVLVGYVALYVSKFTPNNLGAIAVGGVLGLTAIGLLLYKMRRVVAELRQVLATHETSAEAESTEIPAAVEPSQAFSDWFMPPLSVAGQPSPASRLLAVTMVDMFSTSSVSDTFPMRIPSANTAIQQADRLPIFRDTAASLGWGPVGPGQGADHHTRNRPAPNIGPRRVVPPGPGPASGQAMRPGPGWNMPPGPTMRRDVPPGLGPDLRRGASPGRPQMSGVPLGPGPRRDVPPGPIPRRDLPPGPGLGMGPGPGRETRPGPGPGPRQGMPTGPDPTRDVPPGPGPRRGVPSRSAPRQGMPRGPGHNAPGPGHGVPPGAGPRQGMRPEPGPGRNLPSVPGPGPRLGVPPESAPRRNVPPGPGPGPGQGPGQRQGFPPRPGPEPRQGMPPGPVPGAGRRQGPPFGPGAEAGPGRNMPGPEPRRDVAGPDSQRDEPEVEQGNQA